MSKTREETTVGADGWVLFKVAGSSKVSAVAGAIVKTMDEGKKVALLAIGAGAVNQSMKAIASARTMAAGAGKNLYCIPSFQDEKFGGEPGAAKTALRFSIYDLSKIL